MGTIMEIADVMLLAPVIPVLVINDASLAAPLAEALVAGGLRAIEVTLRTPAALEAIRAIRDVPGAVVGAGTVVSRDQVTMAVEAGATFLVSPGVNVTLGRAAKAGRVPYLPGVATASDVMRGLELGLTHFKFFPAEAGGGRTALTMLASAFSQCRFCPTGGVTERNAAAWLSLDPVLCVGGSWVAAGSLSEVEVKARAAAALAR